MLEAAHIKPYGSGGPHVPENGLLLRSDLHTLFDQGYMTVDADELKAVISSRIREEFENRARLLPATRESHSVAT